MNTEVSDIGSLNLQKDKKKTICTSRKGNGAPLVGKGKMLAD